MVSSVRMLLSALLAGATGVSSRSIKRPADGLNKLSRVHALYNQSLAILEQEIVWEAHQEKNKKLDFAVEDWLTHGRDGSISWDHASSIASFVELCRPKHMIEIGSFLGMSANFYLRLMEPWNGHLTSVDPNVRHRLFDSPRDVFNKVNEPFKDRLWTKDAFWMKNTSMESGHWDYANYPPFYDEATVQAIYEDRKVLTPKDFQDNNRTFDMAFIDGAHDYDSVKTDFENVLSIMRPGACIVFGAFDKDAWPDTYNAVMDVYREALESEQGLGLFGSQTALFIDRGFIASRNKGTLVTRQYEE